MKKKDYVGRFVEQRYVNNETGEVSTSTYQIKKVVNGFLFDKHNIEICTISDIGIDIEKFGYTITTTLI